ncbi:MAG: amino acid ABC transporter substrate-binding protein [Atopobiaceae bacterium]|nr:amino acid ABC transporter substrate-binding protein [Atopobiaceae bacterium]
MSTVSRRSFVKGGSLFAGVSALGLVACGGSGSSTAESATDASTESTADSSAESTAESTATTAESAEPMLVNEGKLTCISNMYFPPFEFMDEKTGEPMGFDIDLSKAIAEHMGLEANWTKESNMGFDTLVPTIKSIDYSSGKAKGKADIAIAGMTITDKRKQEVDMSDPYLDSNQSLITRVDSTETLESLDARGKQIAVQDGTTGEEWARENLPVADASKGIVKLDDVINAMNGLNSKSYDAVITDLPVAMYQIEIEKNYPDLQIAEPIPTGEQYGIAVSKDNPALTAAINEALAAVIADGTMKKLQVKWFGSEV